MADRTGRTALHHAAQSGFQEVGFFFFSFPPPTADVSIEGGQLKSFRVEITQMVKLLLNKGANLSAMDKKERQPIHCAAYLGTEILLDLFSFGTTVTGASVGDV